MVSQNLINFTIPHLKLGDTVQMGIDLMEINKISQIVLLNNNQYVGMLSMEILEAQTDFNKLIVDVEPININIFAKANQHLLELLQMANDYNLSIIAVIDSDFNYCGSIVVNELLLQFGKLFGSKEIGAILEIRLNKVDYSMAEIARHVEANDTKILSSFFKIHNNGDTDESILTLKLNRKDISRVVATLERYGYEVISVFSNEPIASLEKDRLDMLLKYLEM